MGFRAVDIDQRWLAIPAGCAIIQNLAVSRRVAVIPGSAVAGDRPGYIEHGRADE